MLALLLLWLVLHLVVGEVLKVGHLAWILTWSSELTKDSVARVDDEVQVSLSTLLVEYEDEPVVQA